MIKAPSIWFLLWHLKWCNEPLKKNETLQCACAINWAELEAAVHTVGRISDLLLGIRQTSVGILAQLCVPWQTDATLDFSVYLFSPVTHLCPTSGDPVDCSTPGFPVYHHLPELCSNLCPSSWWCHPTISSSVVHFSSCLFICK